MSWTDYQKQRKTRRGRFIGLIYSGITGTVTLVLVLTHTWPASVFAAWNFKAHSLFNDLQQYLLTLVIVHVVLLPARYWMTRRFSQPDPPKEELLKDSDLIDD
jgi:hypothetical protein